MKKEEIERVINKHATKNLIAIGVFLAFLLVYDAYRGLQVPPILIIAVSLGMGTMFAIDTIKKALVELLEDKDPESNKKD